MIFVPIVLVALAALAIFASVLMLMNRQEQNIEQRLSGFQGQSGDDGESGLVASRETHISDSAMIQDASDFAGRVAERVGLLTRIEDMLARADLPVRAAEVIFLWGIGVIFLAIVGFILFGSPIIALIFAVLAAVFPWMFLRSKANKRLKLFSSQLPDVLQLLAGALRAGFSFMQALESVAEESTDPTKKEFSRVVSETSLGRPPEEALEEVAERMQSEDLMWAVMAVRIQREVGGNLAEILETVSNTMTERERLRREVKSLTAEGRFSAYILGLFPAGFGFVLFMIQRDFMEPLFTRAVGQALLGAAVFGTVIGFIWLQKIMKIEV